MRIKITKILYICLLFSLFNKITYGQEYKNYGWTQLAEKKGINISFIFYSKANNVKNGIVLKIKNNNEFDAVFNFTLIFKSGGNLKEEFVYNEIKAKQTKAGSNDGLFFLPFDEKTTITHLGIKNFKVAKKN